MRAASSPAAKRVKTKCVAAVIAAAMNFMMNSHHPHAWTTPVDVRTAGCAMAMFRRQTAAANSTIRKGSAVGPTRWRGASMPAVGLGRVGWPPVGFGARQQARRGPQEDLYRFCAENSLETVSPAGVESSRTCPSPWREASSVSRAVVAPRLRRSHRRPDGRLRPFKVRAVAGGQAIRAPA